MTERRSDWQRRTDDLPDWIRPRITYFLETAGERFELDGWGYELVVAELTVLYFEHGKRYLNGFYDTKVIEDYRKEYGVSSNQVEIAKALAIHQIRQPGKMKGTISAMSPVTGSIDYK